MGARGAGQSLTQVRDHFPFPAIHQPVYPMNAICNLGGSLTSPNGDSWLVLTSIVDDPQYLQIPLMLTTHYKREADGSKFKPRPCEVTPPITATR